LEHKFELLLFPLPEEEVFLAGSFLAVAAGGLVFVTAGGGVCFRHLVMKEILIKLN